MDDYIQLLLRRLLATEDRVEFDTLSRDLKIALHERIEKLREQARALKSTARDPERRKRLRGGGKKH